MNESFYVAVATVAPVLLFGTVFAFRVPDPTGWAGRVLIGYTVVFALIGALGTAVALFVAMYALAEQKQMSDAVNTLLFGSLLWLVAANIGRVIEPLVQTLVVLHGQSKIQRLTAKLDRLEKRKEEIKSRTEKLWDYAAVLEEQAGTVGPSRRRHPVARKQTRLLARR